VGKRAVIFVLLGAVINVAVAEGIALWSNNPYERATPISGVTSNGIEFWEIPPEIRRIGVFDRKAHSSSHYDENGRHINIAKTEGWSEFRNFVEEGDCLERATGWPWLCMHGAVLQLTKDSAGTFRARGSVVIRAYKWSFAMEDVSRIIPLRPIWSGIVLNTIVYAFMRFGIVWFAGASRKASRISRGACGACGYKLRYEFEKNCPECGWNRETQ
jgi:hypothetical protein